MCVGGGGITKNFETFSVVESRGYRENFGMKVQFFPHRHVGGNTTFCLVFVCLQFFDLKRGMTFFSFFADWSAKVHFGIC